MEKPESLCRYEKPEAENRCVLDALGWEVELKVFKTNIKEEIWPDDRACEIKLKTQSQEASCFRNAQLQTDRNGNQIPEENLKIICAGDYCGNWERFVYLKDYLQHKPVIKVKRYKPLIGVNLYNKILKWRINSSGEKRNITLKIWELAEIERFTDAMNIYCKNADGAIIFWGPRNPLSLQGALKWRNEILRSTPTSPIPVVLLTDNVSPSMEWIGPQGMLESRNAMDEFCRKNGFLEWFEMVSRDWKSGEKSVFGKAVHCLLEEILNS